MKTFIVKKRKVEEKSKTQMSKQDLERLVEAKITELVQQRGEHEALREKMDKLEEENKKLREIAAGLGKQVADLKEVVRRVKEAEKSLGEGKVTKIPRVTRNVGLQVNFRNFLENVFECALIEYTR